MYVYFSTSAHKSNHSRQTSSCAFVGSNSDCLFEEINRDIQRLDQIRLVNFKNNEDAGMKNTIIANGWLDSQPHTRQCYQPNTRI